MKSHDYGCQCQDCAGMMAAILARDSDGSYFFSDQELAQMATGEPSPNRRKHKMERAIVWQLAPDSDPEQRFIVVTADGETELTGIFDTRAEAEAWIRRHDIPCTASTGKCQCLDCWKER